MGQPVSDCLKAVTLEEVWQAVQSALNELAPDGVSQ